MAISEQDLENAVSQGFQRFSSMKNGENLKTLTAGDILDDLARARILGEIFPNGIFDKTTEKFNFIDKIYSERVKKAFSSWLEQEGDIPINDHVYVSMRNSLNGDFGWLKHLLLPPKEVFNLYLGIPHYIFKSDKDKETVKRFVLNNIDLSFFEKNCNPGTEGFESRDYLRLLSDAVLAEKIDADEAFEFFKRFINKNNEKVLGLDLDCYIESVKRGSLDPDKLLDFYENLLIDSAKIRNPSLLGDSLRELSKIAELIQLDKVDSSRIIQIIDEAIEDDFRINYIRVVLGELAKVIPSGNIDKEEVIRLYDKFIDKLQDMSLSDSTIFYKNLIDLEGVVNQGFIDRTKYKTLLGKFHRNLLNERYSNLSAHDEEKKLIMRFIIENDLPLMELYPHNCAQMISNGMVPSNLVVDLYDKIIRLGELGFDDLEVLTRQIFSGNIDPEGVIRLYEIGVSSLHRMMGPPTPQYSDLQVYNTLRASPSLIPFIKSGEIYGGRVLRMFEKGVGMLSKEKASGLKPKIDMISRYAELIIESGETQEKIFRFIDDLLDNEDLCRYTLFELNSLGRFANTIDPSRIIGLFKKYLVKPEDLASAAATSIHLLVDMVSVGRISLEQLIEVYNLALDGPGKGGLARSLPKLTSAYPLIGIHFYEKVLERYASDVLYYTQKSVYPSDRFHISFVELDSFWRELRSMLATYDGDQKHIEKLRDIASLFAANQNRVKIAQELYEKLNHDKSIPSEELISRYILGNYKDLKPYERDQITDMLINFHNYTRRHPETFIAGGYSSYKIIDMTDDIIKFATSGQNKSEDKVYSLRDSLHHFSQFIAEKRGEILEFDDGLSMLVLENLNKKGSGYIAAERIFKSLTGQPVPWKTHHQGHNLAMLNLFILGFAHKELTHAAVERRIEFPEAEHMASGVIHYEAIRIPVDETSDRVYRELMRSVPEQLVSESGKIIERFIGYARKREGRPIILGDNKVLENMRNGYLYDFANAGKGLEIDDITYALVEPRLSIPLDRLKQFIGAYILMRSLHDPEFRDNASTIYQEMMSMADCSTLKSLSRYAANTRKRVEQMESGEISARRQYFINAMANMLKIGNFSDFR